MSTGATPSLAVLPRHVAIIMDGNGRWARQRGLPRVEGHRAGIEAVRDIVRASGEVGLKYLTLYAFSVENWRRPAQEIRFLMGLLRQFLRDQLAELNRNRVRLRAIGRLGDLPGPVRRQLERTTEATRHNDGMVLTLALSYGARAELADAVQAIAREVAAGRLRPEDVGEATISQHLYAPELPDPDLLVRTSGEMRVSNFLLWQISYCEFWVTKTLWPDFRREELWRAFRSYAKRQRRFGRVGAPEVE